LLDNVPLHISLSQPFWCGRANKPTTGAFGIRFVGILWPIFVVSVIVKLRYDAHFKASAATDQAPARKSRGFDLDRENQTATEKVITIPEKVELSRTSARNKRKAKKY